MEIKYSEDVQMIDNTPVVSYECISALRESGSQEHIIMQPGGQENALMSEADIIIGGGNRGGGKAQPYSSLVCTPFGYRKMGDLKIGDKVSSITGGFQSVIGIYEQGEKNVYRFHFNDGTYTDCTEDHIWKIKRTGYNHKSRWINGTGIEDEWRLWTAKMIMTFLDRQERGELSKTNSHLLIPLCEPVRFTKSFSNQYVPKSNGYIIGAILGDGCITNPVATGNIATKFTTADCEIVDIFKSFGLDMSKFVKQKGNKSSDYTIRDVQLKEDIKKLGLHGCDSSTKFIPEYYKFAPLDVRWSLIQGLMDTDGCIDKRGHCSYTTVSPKFAEDVAFVLRSLGAYVSIKKKKSGYKKDGEFIECKDSYDLYIKIPNSDRLFRLSRKKERVKSFNGGGSTYGRRIVRYEFIGVDKCRCIKVSHPSALYLTNDFIVTHNTILLLCEALEDIQNPYFNALILRKERDDLVDIVNKSRWLFADFGEYRSAKDSMRWDLHQGGSISFSYHADSVADFKDRFQGREYAYIAIDEITQMAYPKFKYIQTTNRNSKGLRCRMIGTCNPDPESWVATFIDWWIGEDGLPIKERDGVLRYCFMNGEDVSDIIWGNTPEECYELARGIIDTILTDGEDWRNYILSVAFVRAELDDNKKLLESDPKYKAKLAGQSEEQRQRDLQGNWKFKSAGDDIIKWQHMEEFFNNAPQTTDNIRRVSCDVAFTGGDNLVMWLWVGNHIQDVYACKLDSRKTIEVVKAKLFEWEVREENFTYDLNGVGQTFKGFFPRANPFNNLEAVDPKLKNVYRNLKSQSAYMFALDLIEGKYSINPELLNRKFNGVGFSNIPLREILLKERRAIRRDDSKEQYWAIIPKDIMKSIVGHSPDFLEALFYRKIFDIKKRNIKPKGLGWL